MATKIYTNRFKNYKEHNRIKNKNNKIKKTAKRSGIVFSIKISKISISTKNV